MEYCIFPMKTINITQRALDSYSHKNLEAWDIAGSDTGIESAYAPCRVKVLAKLPYETTGFSNTVFFGSCDEIGSQCKVRTENGQERILTFALTHDNNISDISVGHIYQSGEKIYDEGTKGKATGNHIHLEVAEGWQYKKIKRSDGVWVTPNLVHLADVFLQLQGFTEVKNLNGYKMQTVDSREVKETYHIYYEANGEQVNGMPGNQTKQTGETVHISASAPTRNGYKFLHWCVHPDGQGTIYKPSDEYSGNWSSSLYAIWQPNEYSLADAIKVFQQVAGKLILTSDERKKYDIDGDGEITLADAIKVFQKVAGK